MIWLTYSRVVLGVAGPCDGLHFYKDSASENQFFKLSYGVWRVAVGGCYEAEGEG